MLLSRTMVMNVQSHKQWLPHKKSDTIEGRSLSIMLKGDAMKGHALPLDPFMPKRMGCEGKGMPSHSCPKEGMQGRGTCPHLCVKLLLEKRDGGAALGQRPSITLFKQQGGGVRA